MLLSDLDPFDNVASLSQLMLVPDGAELHNMAVVFRRHHFQEENLEWTIEYTSNTK